MDGTRVASGARWFVGGLAGALVLVFASTAAAPARAASDATATLWLDRSAGPPGTKVIATAWGYAGCHAPATTTPSPADGATAGGGVVKIFWEGFDEAVGSAVVPTSGVVEVPFSVPAEATAQRYSIVARCMTDSKLTDDDLFVVTRSEAPLVVPPKTVPPPSVPSPSVSPSTAVPSTAVPSATLTPRTVRVPRVVGMKVADAKATLSPLGLVLRVTSGEGDVVASQSPTVGSMVGVGHAVRVTIKPAVVAPQLVPVPNLIGEQAAAARSALSAVGLRLGGTAEADRDIAGQQPAPGTLVAAGTTITVTFADPFPWSKAALLALVVLAFGAVTYGVARRWLDRRWVRNKLRIVVPAAPAVVPRLTESDSEPPMPVVRLEPHADAGVHILKGD
ncbi:PASTA domain-containing protein [Kribbella sp. NBC_01484]|uniref:PASTA domain-containing protein n=1 Tax=Kribbella sp. NBC_01484 TaxID=2903579 RepID=UPI002E30E51A|nr:PASTA domain-containing protein [Kribbella sp. NBC_01484]